MKTRLARLTVATLMMFAIVACSSMPTQQPTGQAIDDGIVTAKVKAKLTEDPVTKAHQISVETFKGTVQLSGFVNSRADINKAVEVARGVGGVTAVKNDMRLK